MSKKSLSVDIALFLFILLLLFLAVPAISALLKQLFVLQVVIVIAGAIALRFVIQRIRRRLK